MAERQRPRARAGQPRPRRRYTQRARAVSQQNTRTRLLDAAAEAIYSGRWPDVSLDALASAAQVSKQTLLRHFGSRDELLLQALIKSVEQVLDERWSAPIGDIPGVVENLLDHYEVWGERARRIGSWQGGPSALADMSQAGRQMHYEWVDFVFEPQLRALNARARRRRRSTLIALCDVQTWWVLAHDLRLEHDEVHAILVGLIEDLVAGKG